MFLRLSREFEQLNIYGMVKKNVGVEFKFRIINSLGTQYRLHSSWFAFPLAACSFSSFFFDLLLCTAWCLGLIRRRFFVSSFEINNFTNIFHIICPLCTQCSDARLKPEMIMTVWKSFSRDFLQKREKRKRVSCSFCHFVLENDPFRNVYTCTMCTSKKVLATQECISHRSPTKLHMTTRKW